MKLKTIYLLAFLFTAFHQLKAQGKNLKPDTAYYLLDTASIPIKDRMFKIETEEPYKAYILSCKCYVWDTDPVFLSPSDKTKTPKYISNEVLRQIKTISISELIGRIVKHKKDKTDRMTYFFIEPEQGKMKLTKVSLLEPSKPGQVLDGIPVKIYPVNK